MSVSLPNNNYLLFEPYNLRVTTSYGDNTYRDFGDPNVRTHLRNLGIKVFYKRKWSVFVAGVPTKYVAVYNAYGRRVWFGRLDDVRVAPSFNTTVDTYLHSLVTNSFIYERCSSGIFTRPFGVEIECSYPCDVNLMDRMRQEGVNFVNLGYTHVVTTDWKLTTDASVSNTYGYKNCEIVSPILIGDEGLAQLKKVCKVLSEIGAKVNKTCGLHIHHEARDLTYEERQHVFASYAANEDIIDTLVSASRRGDSNRYCQSNKRVQPYGMSLNCRYYKVNYLSFNKYGTIEFRQHHGTIDYSKILHWIRFTQAFIQNRANISTCSSLEQLLTYLGVSDIPWYINRARALAR